MEIIQLTNFEKVVEKLRRMSVSNDKPLVFTIDKYKTVTATAWRLNRDEGLKFVTRKKDDNVYIWRLK